MTIDVSLQHLCKFKMMHQLGTYGLTKRNLMFELKAM